ncbi:hypothetical protein BUALT_Bualt12G0124500 [Buddleja alternifolia]|uniref:Hexosyltransferase n=1 Tax=Buddleja alternifolia TaxID=168488 RepID=A0AAV6X1G5_9LAMI|nr:hypothetical protein BUALT_Bualt12G0124500 [Buddleja alternifolia]
MLHSSETNVNSLEKKSSFSIQLAAKTVPRSLRCIPLVLTTDYHLHNYEEKDFPNKEKLEDPSLYHYAIFSDNNEDMTLRKLDTLSPGLITFYNLTYSLDRRWHVLGLEYDPVPNQTEIENVAVVHYNGNYKPWLDLAIANYKSYRSRYVMVELNE